MAEQLITIGPGGVLRFIYDDSLAGALAHIGQTTIKRASAVEPAPGGGWEADLGVSGGPVLAGFATRAAALAAEVEWLNRNLLGAA